MSMADPLPKLLNLSFKLVRTDDKLIICMFCNQSNCEYEYGHCTFGVRRFSGVHYKCYLEHNRTRDG